MMSKSPHRPGEGARHDSSGAPSGKKAGRPPNPPGQATSAAGALGARLREVRTARGLTLAAISARTGYSIQHIGAVERGNSVASEGFAVACEQALDVPGALRELLPEVFAEQARARHERAAWRRGLPLPTTLEGDWLVETSRCRSPLTGQLVENLEVITGQQRDLYHQLSSAEMTGHVEAHLGLLTALLGGNPPDRLRHRAASAAAEAAGFAAWLRHDRQEPARAARLYKLADDAAREAGDRRLGSYLAGYQGLARAHDPAAAAAWLAGAVEDSPRSLSGAAASWLSALHAEAAARSGDRRAAKSSLSQATEQLSGRRAGQKEAWMYDFDQGSLAMRAGSCHVALGDHRLAVAAFQDALTLLSPGHERRRAEIHLGLARAHLGLRDGEQALRNAGEALSAFTVRGSAAGIRLVRCFSHELAARGQHAAASALDDQARAMGLGRA